MLNRPDNPIRVAVRRAYEHGERTAYERALATIGRSLINRIAPDLFHAPPLLLKADDREHGPNADPDLQSDPHQALLLAQIDHRIRSMETGTDPEPGDRALHALWDDPEALSRVLAPHAADEPMYQKAMAYAIFLKAAERSPKGGISLKGTWYPGGQWIPSSVIAAASPEEKTELAERNQGARPNPLNAREIQQKATAEKRGTRDQLRKRVADIASDLMLRPQLATPDKYRDLAESLKGDHLSVADLRALRLKLSASFGGGRRKAQMVAALLAHADSAVHDLENPEPEVAPEPKLPKKPKEPKPGTFLVLMTDSLSLDPVRFQFKVKVDAQGVTKGLANVKQFNPDFAGVISVWFDPADGKTYVVNGHHRFELARRTGYPHLAVRYLAAKDAREARAKGALINIAEGRGSALDAAKFLRDSGRDAEDLYAHGISPEESLAKNAGILVKLNDSAFDRLARGSLDLGTALAVAKHLPDHDRQEKLFKLIARKEEDGKEFTNRNIEEMARQMAAAPSATVTSSTLWGEESTDEDTFLERAEMAAHVRAELSKEHHDYSALSSERRASATADAGNTLNTEENKKRAEVADVSRHAYDTLAHRKGPVADALDAAAVQIKQAKTKKEKESIRAHTIATVRGLLADIASGKRPPADRQGVGEVDGGRTGDGATERAGAAQAGAGETAEDGRGLGNDADGVDAKLKGIAANAIPRDDLKKTHRNLMKYSDLLPNGYTVSHWMNPSDPKDQVLEYNPTSGGGRVEGRPRLTARTGAEVEAIHEAMGLPAPTQREVGPDRFDPESGVVLSKKEHAAKLAGAAPQPSSPNGTSPVIDLADPHALATAAHAAGKTIANFNDKPFDPAAPHHQTHNVPISDVYDKLHASGKLPSGTTLDAFKAAMQSARTAGALDLARSDLPQHLSDDQRAKMQRSEMAHPLNPSATSHYLSVPSDQPKPAFVPYTPKKRGAGGREAAPTEDEFAAASQPAKAPLGKKEPLATPAPQSQPAPEALHMYASEEDGTTSAVYRHPDGYAVVLHDNDTGESVGKVKTFATESEAVSHAEDIAGIESEQLPAPERRAKSKYFKTPGGAGFGGSGGGSLPGGRQAHATGAHIDELNAYDNQSAKGIVNTPLMTAREKSAANAANKNTLPLGANVGAPNRWASLAPDLLAIPKGDSRFVEGHRVRRDIDGAYQVERRGGFLKGSAEEIAGHIKATAEKESGYPSHGEAMARAAAYDEPDPFTDPGKASEDAKLRDEVPEGTKAVSLDDDTRGRVGTVRRDPGTGRVGLQFDGGAEHRGFDFEPLDVRHSWRDKEQREAAKPKGGKAESLFGGEEAGDKAEPHELTQSEYVKRELAAHPSIQNSERGSPHNTWAVRDSLTPGMKSDHELAVANAISEGKKVPAHVLADYPNQAKRAAAAKPSSPNGTPEQPKGEFFDGWDTGANLPKARSAANAAGVKWQSGQTAPEIVAAVKAKLAAGKAPAAASGELFDNEKDNLFNTPETEVATPSPVEQEVANRAVAANPSGDRLVSSMNLRKPGGGENSHEEMPTAPVAAAPQPSSPNDILKGTDKQIHDEFAKRFAKLTPDQLSDAGFRPGGVRVGPNGRVQRYLGKRNGEHQWMDYDFTDTSGELQRLLKATKMPPQFDIASRGADQTPEPEKDIAPHEMTQADFLAASDDPSDNEFYKKTHRNAVKRAVDSGEHVPPEVLADYPDIAGKAGTVPQPSSPNVTLPHVALSHAIGDRLSSGALEKNELWQHADKHFGGTRAEGKYGPSDAYDAMEAGFNRALAGKTDPTAPLEQAQQQARDLKEQVDALPTQTNRSGNKESFQQFSTPPQYAFAANWVANLTPGEHVLEPSAGTGDLAVHAKNAGAEVHVNELDPRRADFLRDQFGKDRTHVENAEQISGILPKRGVAPTTVVMNPPFSQTAGRMGDKKELMTGARHIAEAGRMLAPGGRLVAIVGRGMTPTSPTYREWFKDMAAKGFTLRANMGVAGEEYKKYGTSFGTRMLVFDKTPPEEGQVPVTGDATDIPDLMAKLEGVRNERSELAGVAPGEPVRGEVSADAGGATGGGTAGGAAGATGAGVVPAGATGRSAVAGVPDGTARARGGSGGGRPSMGDQFDGTGVRDATGRGRKAAGGAGAVQPAGGPVGQPAGRPEAETERAGDGASAGGKPVQQSAPSLPGVRPPERIPVKAIHAANSVSEAAGESGESQYESYRPQRMHVDGMVPHSTKLVESAAMAGVEPPTPTYSPTLSPDVISNAVKDVKGPDGTVVRKRIGVSEAGLESIVYAGQAHQGFLQAAEGDIPTHNQTYIAPDGKTWDAIKLPDGRWSLDAANGVGESRDFLSDESLADHLSSSGYRKQDGQPFKANGEAPRRGFFVGDGTGAGKGRQIAGVILDNVNQGKPKHVWVSEKDKLFNDAKRDWADMGQDPEDITHFDKLAKGKFAANKGVAFVTYDKLKGGPRDEKQPRNVDHLIKWLGKDFDGVIAFDEAHNAGNADDTPGARGTVKASEKALAMMKLQKALPKAKIMYVSATGATKPENLAYADRLGLWGRGTAFTDKRDFMNQMNEGGTSAMESVAQSMKARGLYVARSLSYDGVKTDRLQHNLTDEQKYVYDNLAEGWQAVLQNIDKALEHIVGDKKDVKHAGRARSAAMSQFQGAQQRFFNQAITSMMVPTVIKGMEKDIAEGRSPVVQLVNTMESATKKALADRAEGEDLEDLDLSPKTMLIGFLNKSFPIHRLQKIEDENGNVSMIPALDSYGKPIEDPQAVALRDEMISRVNDMRIPESPLDQIINHFGHENVAEATGRTVRVVNKPDDNGVSRPTEEKRNSKQANEAEARAFQAGKKKILVFSDAGGTGASYHADKGAGNQGQRSHYLLQPGWRADKAVQGLGRTHRTNQSSAPIFHLLETPEIPGQKRFVSTIARRLSQLGALTRGQASTGGGAELFNAADNLESKESQEGLEAFVNNLKRGQTINGMPYQELMGKLGFKVDQDAGGGGGWRTKGQSEVPEMRQFLNRVLALKLADQQEVFHHLDEAIQSKIEQAKANGTLDNGVERFPATKVTKTGEPETVYRDPETGAEAKLVRTIATTVNEKRKFPVSSVGVQPVKFVKNGRSGRVWAVYNAAPKTDAKSGNIIPMYTLRGPTGQSHLPQFRIDGGNYEYNELDHRSAKEHWDQEYKDTPDTIEQPEHFVTGDLLSVWDKLPKDRPKIYRVNMHDGSQVVGRHIPSAMVEETLKRLGATSEGGQSLTASDAHARVRQGETATLANGWRIRRALVGGERRLELLGPIGMHKKTLQEDGVRTEKIASQDRYFIPVGEDGVKVLERVIKSRNAPVTEVKKAVTE